MDLSYFSARTVDHTQSTKVSDYMQISQHSSITIDLHVNDVISLHLSFRFSVIVLCFAAVVNEHDGQGYDWFGTSSHI